MIFRDVVARGHGDDEIFAFLVFGFRDAKNHFVFVNAKFGGFTDRQENGMLVVFWPNAVEVSRANSKKVNLYSFILKRLQLFTEGNSCRDYRGSHL